MVAALKQVVTVGEDGKIEIPRSQLAPGTRAEVVVMVEESAATDAPDARLALLDAIQASFRLDEQAANEWAAQVLAERRAWRRPPA